ncbi:MAG: HigA family addiction module antitoxin [Rhodospirillaceae bacterium]
MADSDEQPDAPHPGSILRTEFLEPLGLSANALALALRVPAPRISELVRGRRGMTPDTALRLAQAFGAPAEFWLGLQTAHDLSLARAAEGARITAEVEPVVGSDKPSRKAINKVVKRYS